MLATGSFDQTVRIWDVETGAAVYSLRAHNDVVVSAQFSHDDSLLCTAGFDGAVRIWDVKTGKSVRSFLNSNLGVCYAKFSPNSKFILMGSFDDTWKLINSTSGDVVKTYTGHQFNDYCIFGSFFLHNDKKYIISGSADNSVYIWDLNSRELIQSLPGHNDVVVAVAGHSTQSIIASGALDADMTVKLWTNDQTILAQNNLKGLTDDIDERANYTAIDLDEFIPYSLSQADFHESIPALQDRVPFLFHQEESDSSDDGEDLMSSYLKESFEERHIAGSSIH